MFSFSAMAQVYGNEWINYNQSYYKFNIGSDGIYRISQQDLINAGVPLGTLIPKNIQLFKNGVEQYIYVDGESDGSFDATDFIEFHATHNQGELDTRLYRKASEQTNPYVSLYTDTASYFITWSTVASTKHLSNYYDGNYSGKTPDDYFTYEAITSFQDDFFEGIPNNNSPEQSFSEYTEGEGYLSSRSVEYKQFDIETLAPYAAGPNASIEVKAYGINNPPDFVNGFNHGFGLSVGTKANRLVTKEHNGYSMIKFGYSDISFATSQLSDTTSIFMGEIDQVGRPISNYCIPYIKVRYPRSFDLLNKSQLVFRSSTSSTYFRFKNFTGTKSSPLIYDVSNGQRIIGDVSGGTLQFNSSFASPKDLIIFDATDAKSVSSIKAIAFTPISKANANYLIITNRKLQAGATEYSDYRSSLTGGSYSVTTIYAEDLYDQFYYGVHHAMAVKNAISFIHDQLKEPIDNILLLGKGQVYKNVRFDIGKREQFDLVPTIGNPPTDYLFVSKLDASSMALDVPIGRVAAQNDEMVRDYLAKVKLHEATTPADWHKKIIQVVGGKDQKENQQFNDYVTSYFKIANDSFLGATRKVFSKNEAVPVSSTLIEVIQNEINEGANIFNYFGHGSSQVLEVEIGDAKDLNNYGKYPFFIFNGCALGNSFVDKSIGEEYMFEKDKGSITWLASTGYGFPYELISYTRILHEELLQKQYGGTLGAAVKTTIDRYQNTNENLNMINCRQLFYQGDPAIKIHAPALPDVYANNGRINNDFSAVDDILLNLDIYNIGRTTQDSVEVIVVAQNSDSTKEVYRGLIDVPNFTSTEELVIDKTDFFRGLVKFTVTLDPNNKIAELAPTGEMNNTLAFDVFFELKKPLLIYPAHNAIVTSTAVDYTFQIVNTKNEDISIEIQLDTTPRFNSSLLKTEKFTTDRSLVEHSMILPPLDGHDFFYRIKTIQNGEESDWSQRSFAYLFNTNTGWSEQHNENLSNVSLNFLRWNDDTSAMEFTRRISDNYTFTTSGSVNTNYWRRMVVSGQFVVTQSLRLNLGQPGYESVDGIHIVAFDPDSEKRFSESTSYYNQPYYVGFWNASPRPDQAEYYVVGNKTGLYNFHTANKEDRDSFIRFLQMLPDGYHIMFRNDLNTGIEDWEPALWTELAKFGIVNLQSVKEGEPFGVFGTKGDPAQKREFFADYDDKVTPPTEQSIDKSFNIYPRVTAGTITSESVGPATSWSSIALDFKPSDSGTDRFDYGVIATDRNGRDTTYFINQTANTLDITAIDAKRFPYTKLVVNIEDTAGFTPYAIHRWTVFYEGVTEGLIATDDLDETTADTIEQGQAYRFATNFKNISPITFDSSSAEIRIVDESGIATVIDTLSISEIKSSEFITLSDTLNTDKLAGKYQLYMNANFKQNVLENEYNNNLYYKEFYVNRDVRNPLLDVTFDGIHILNNDIVSANTTIVITGQDENEYLYLDDPSLFTMQLRYPNTDTFITIDESNVNFEFTPSTSATQHATITFRNIDLEDGTYTLKVSLQDRSSNGESIPPYAIDFKVVTMKSISNLYPYPNPFTGCARFAFTVTGGEVPDQILISIYTITGRLVKQIDETELGPIRIGNNLSEYCWDGTDDFGDKLANGVYLYKAEIRSNGKTIDLFETSGDHLFNNGFGKLYIAR
jgi:hypothetical protein